MQNVRASLNEQANILVLKANRIFHVLHKGFARAALFTVVL